MWRRLDALCRGRAIDPERLRGQLYVAANAGVKLDDPGWQAELVAMGREIRPRLIAFDPLARMKAPGREENAQSGMAAPIEFLRTLREETDAAVSFVHHTGHAGEQMRGSSDLETVWETRLTWKRDGQSPLVTIESEHREAEVGDPIHYRIGWHHNTRSMRFHIAEDATLKSRDLEAEIAAYLDEHPRSSTNSVAAGIKASKKIVADTLKASSRWTFEAGPNRSKLWFPHLAQNHRGNPEPPEGVSGSLSSLSGYGIATRGTTTTGSLVNADEVVPDDAPEWEKAWHARRQERT
jgi:hypothetical protein